MAGFFKKLFNALFPEHMTKEEFLAKAKEVHGETYDYSKVRYKDEDTRVTVICPKHGKFLVTPKAHIEGEGCEECKNECVSKYLAYINSPEREKEAAEANSSFIQSVLTDIYAPDTDDAENRYIGDYNDDKTELIKCPKDFSGTYFIPDGVEMISLSAFKNCKDLESVIMPDSVLEIDNNAFRGCTNLTYVKLSDALQSIGWFAFEGCSSLTSILIPDSVEQIGRMAFSGCVNLETIILPKSLKRIDGDTFEGCKSLQKITIHQGVKEIDPHAFKDCVSLTQITIPEGVEHIHSGAFSGCLNVTTITMPKSIRTLDSNTEGIFNGCTNLKEIIVPIGQKERIADLFWENDAPYKALLIEK